MNGASPSVKNNDELDQEKQETATTPATGRHLQGAMPRSANPEGHMLQDPIYVPFLNDPGGCQRW